MAHHHGIDFFDREWEWVPIALLFGPVALYQTAFQQYRMVSRSEQVHGASHLFRSTKKLQCICHWIQSPADVVIISVAALAALNIT
jgi:hypothetical protein